jgi:hypothetical protein
MRESRLGTFCFCLCRVSFLVRLRPQRAPPSTLLPRHFHHLGLPPSLFLVSVETKEQELT